MASTILHHWGHRRINWPAACRSEEQRSSSHNTRETGHPPPLTAPLLKQAGPTSKPSKSNPTLSPPYYLKNFQCFGQTHTPGEMGHDCNFIFLPPQPSRVHWTHIGQHNLPYWRHCNLPWCPQLPWVRIFMFVRCRWLFVLWIAMDIKVDIGGRFRFSRSQCLSVGPNSWMGTALIINQIVNLNWNLVLTFI